MTAATRAGFKPWCVFPPTCLLVPILVHCFSNSMHSCLRAVLPRIPHNWPALWTWVQEAVLGYSFSSLFVMGTLIIHLYVFWGLCLLLLFSERLGFLSFWKVIDDTDVTACCSKLPRSSAVSSAAALRDRITLSAAFHALMSQFLIQFPLLLLSTPVLYLRGVSTDLALPSFTEHLIHIVICTFAQEVCYYHCHRLMHSVAGLWSIHRRHHVKYFVTGLDSLAVPSVEVVLLRFLPFIVGPLICGCHLSTLYVWTCISTLMMVLMYSKHHFPLLPSPRAHLFHQQHYGAEAVPLVWSQGGASFGTFGVMDRWYETDCAFASQAEHHRIIWDLDTIPAKSKFRTFSMEPSSWEFSWDMFFCVAWFQSWKPSLLWAARVYWSSVVTFKANTFVGILGSLFLGYWLLIRDGVAWAGYPGAGPFCNAPHVFGFLWETNSTSIALYWILSGIFLMVDAAFDALGLVARYRVQYAPLHQPKGSPVQPLFHRIDWKMWVISTHWVTCNLLSVAFIFPLVVSTLGFSSVCNSPHPAWPAWYVVVFQLGVLAVLVDVWFFLMHRANHSRFLYPYIHKQHHMLRATVAVGGLACHPVEQWMVNFSTLFLPAYLIGTSLNVWILWCCIVTTSVCLSHSGYVIPYFPMGADPHDFHHWYLNCEFGAGGMMDTLFGTTFKEFKKRQLEAKQAEN